MLERRRAVDDNPDLYAGWTGADVLSGGAVAERGPPLPLLPAVKTLDGRSGPRESFVSEVMLDEMGIWLDDCMPYEYRGLVETTDET